MNPRLTILVVLCGCTVRAEEVGSPSITEFKSETICHLIDNLDNYVGERVVVRGELGRVPHGMLLYDNSCPEWTLDVKGSAVIGDNREAAHIVNRHFKKTPTTSVTVTYTGVLTAKIVMTGCNRPSCYNYTLEEAQLLAVRYQR